MLVLNLIIHHELNTSYNRSQYKFPVPVQLMEVLRVVVISGYYNSKQLIEQLRSKFLWGLLHNTSHDLTVMRVATSIEKTPYYIL
jgi:hypothetical protein